MTTGCSNTVDPVTQSRMLSQYLDQSQTAGMMPCYASQTSYQNATACTDNSPTPEPTTTGHFPSLSETNVVAAKPITSPASICEPEPSQAISLNFNGIKPCGEIALASATVAELSNHLEKLPKPFADNYPASETDTTTTTDPLPATVGPSPLPEANNQTPQADATLLSLTDPNTCDATEPHDWADHIDAAIRQLSLDDTKQKNPLEGPPSPAEIDRMLMQIRNECPLLIRNMAFAEEIRDYGDFTRYPAERFMPGNRVYLYVELDNFNTKESSRGYHTAISSRLEIIDAEGHCHEDRLAETLEDFCSSPRRDLFVSYVIQVPEQLPPGQYSLQLTITDMNSNKTDTEKLDFHVVPAL